MLPSTFVTFDLRTTFTRIVDDGEKQLGGVGHGATLTLMPILHSWIWGMPPGPLTHRLQYHTDCNPAPPAKLTQEYTSAGKVLMLIHSAQFV